MKIEVVRAIKITITIKIRNNGRLVTTTENNVTITTTVIIISTITI